MNSDDQPPVDDALFRAEFWPAATDSAGFQAMQLLPATGPGVDVLAYLDAIPSHRLVGTVPATLRRAVIAISKLEGERRLQASAVPSGNMDKALDALRGLRDALEGEGEDLGLDESTLASYIADPPALQNDLRNVAGRFLYKQLASSYDRVATFSIILFDEKMHDGAVSDSFQKERADWQKALKPPGRGSPDLHLAIIPPPSAIDGVRNLAADLGCEDMLPCVIFLGSKPDFSKRSHIFPGTWAALSLSRAPPKYPDQLREVYRTVYARGALKPGEPVSAAADKFFTVLRGAVNPRAVLRLFAGAVGGSKLVEVAEIVAPD